MGAGRSKKHASFEVVPTRTAARLDEVYKTPRALRAALTDRIRTKAEHSGLSFGEL